jgi:hypothetical protein
VNKVSRPRFRIRDLLKKDKINPVEISDKLGELQESLFQAREALGNAQEVNRNLTTQLEDSKKLAAVGADMEYVEDGGFYVRASERKAGNNIPYCPVCWTADKKLVPLNPMYGEGFYMCTVHKSNHETRAHRSRMNQITQSQFTDADDLGPNGWMTR